VAGDDDADRVGTNRAADGPGCPRLTCPGCEIAITGGLTEVQGRELMPNSLLEGGADQFDGHIKASAGAGEVFGQFLRCLADDRIRLPWSATVLQRAFRAFDAEPHQSFAIAHHLETPHGGIDGSEGIRAHEHTLGVATGVGLVTGAVS